MPVLAVEGLVTLLVVVPLLVPSAPLTLELPAVLASVPAVLPGTGVPCLTLVVVPPNIGQCQNIHHG